MRITRYNDSTIGKVISMRCRRSINNDEMIVLDNSKLEEVYVYDFGTIDEVISFLQDIMNIDIKSTRQLPVTTKLVNHQNPGVIYQFPNEQDENLDDYHAFFSPLEEVTE